MAKTNPVYEMQLEEYNKKLATILKGMPEFTQPEWSLYVKSGPSKVKPPQDPDFWARRAASILRQIYTNEVVGVNRFKTRYGSLKNRGMQPEHFVRASGKIIRTMLQQGEKAGLLEKSKVAGKRAGRVLTKQGKDLLESIK